MNRKFFRKCAFAGAIGLFAACTDTPTGMRTAPLIPAAPSLARDSAFNGLGKCMADDAVRAPTGTISGVKFGDDPTTVLNCTSQDVKIATALVASYRIADAAGTFSGTPIPYNAGDNVSCIVNRKIELTMSAKLNETASSTRSDIGIWIATDGGNAQTGACNHYNLPVNPLTPGTGVSTGDNDSCGDLNAGAVVPSFPLGTFEAVCEAAAGSNQLHVPSCLGWTEPGADKVCPLPDAKPNSPPNWATNSADGFRFGTLYANKSKCNCEGFNVPITVIQPPNLTLSKTADSATVSAGSQIGFVVTLNNTGVGAATTVALNDPLPAGTGVSWSLAAPVTGWSITGSAPNQALAYSATSLAAGGSTSAHVISSTTAASCATYKNVAKATLGNGPAPDSVVATTTVNCSNLSITKTPATQTVSAGTSFSWTVTLTNSGDGTAFGATINDPLPALTGVSYGLGQGSDATCGISQAGLLTCGPKDLAKSGTLVAVINASTTAGTSCSASGIINIATGVATGVSAIKDTATTVINCPKLEITKTPATQTVNAGSPFSWTVTLTNSGAGTAVGSTISDPLPQLTGVAYTLGSGSDATCSINAANTLLSCTSKDLAAGATTVAIINATTTSGTSCSASGIINIATGLATGVSAVKDTATTVIACPNLSILKTPDKTGDTGYLVTVPGTATFTITVSNSSAAGTGTATNVVLTDTLPGDATKITWSADNTTECVNPIGTVVVNSVTRQRLVCTIPTLAAGGSFTVHVSASLTSSNLQLPPSTVTDPIEIDGDLADGAAAGKDWGDVGTSLLNCIANPKVGCDLDKPTGTTDDSFGQGTKEDTSVPSVVSGSIPNNKSDLLRFYVSSERVLSNNFLYLAWERVQAPSGTTNMDFELNQSSVKSANGVTPVRTAGDILIKYDLEKGGTTPTLGFHRWVTSGNAATVCEASNTVPCWGKLTSLLTGAKAAVNSGTVSDPILASGQSGSRTLDALTFGEASIDLQTTGIFSPSVCVNFGQAYLKSRSSDAFSSEIKDFIAPIPVSVTNCAPLILPNEAWAKAGNVSGNKSDTGEIKVTE